MPSSGLSTTLTTTTGISLVAGSRFRRVRTSQPSRSGRRMSSVMAAGLRSIAFEMASPPLRATSVPKPARPTSRVNLLELVEDALLVLFVNADAGVGERNLDRVRKATRLDRDHAALGSELDGVGREVEQHLLHLAGVCGDLSRGAIDDLELNLLLRG